MDRSQKADSVASLNAVFNEVGVVVVTRNLGMSVGQSTALRTKMREAREKALNGRSMQDLSPEERQKVMDEVGFKGELVDFFEHLRTDPQFYYKTPDELFRAYAYITKVIDPELRR